MTADAAKIAATVEGYFTAFENLDADEVLKLFAANATVEDPIGSPVLSDPDAIRAFYGASMEAKPVLKRTGPIRVVNNEAAFPFRALVSMPEGDLEIDVIDVMKFDNDGKITEMRAYFGETNIRPAPAVS
ncbi:MAG: nuclear transport factor 2 family protein [Pseudomonadota bacterium]